MYSQDLIVTHSGDSIHGDILYVTPSFYQMVYIKHPLKKKYGSSEKIQREDIAAVYDNGDLAQHRKFGKIKISLLNSEDVIKKPLYSANDSSIYFTYIKTCRS